MRFASRLSPEQRTAGWAALLVVTMVGLSFAAVPFYRWFCQVTGFAGTTSVAAGASDVILDETVKVRFDASLERGMPWTFRPVVREMTLRLGETGLAFFEAHNPTDHPVAGIASYNVTPDAAGGFFEKIACFCFDMQVLQPGETVQMPVSFFVSPDILTDRDGRFVHTITLSYTFHESLLPLDDQQAALTRPDDAPLTGPAALGTALN
ncbi:MAG: cytochrome c oxidase assembly protein [Rhodobacterales bacterium]|nr:cytochrome c oxidase assembly protein [Rhodobacterales bacterium]NCT11954.1 cytochrome c oxidase assembly protein [Rhodobacterales bacterium]